MTGKYLHPFENVLLEPKKNTPFKLYLYIQYNELNVFYVNVQVYKYQILHIRGIETGDNNAKIKIYDGPGVLSPSINKTLHIKLSSFQAALILSSVVSEIMININFYGSNASLKSVTLNTTYKLELNNMIDSFHSFIFNCTSFVNLTVFSFKYQGSNEVLCSFGGVVMMDFLFRGIYSVFDSDSPKELRTMCGPLAHLNYYPGKTWPFSHVSSGNKLLLALYAYKQYSTVSINITVTPAICPGLTLDVACLHSSITHELYKAPLVNEYFKLRNQRFSHHHLVLTIQDQQCVTIQLVENRVILYRYKYRYRYRHDYNMKKRQWQSLVGRQCSKHQILYFLGSKGYIQKNISIKFELNPITCLKLNENVDLAVGYTSYEMDFYGITKPKVSSFVKLPDKTSGFNTIYNTYSLKQNVKFVKSSSYPSFHHLSAETTQMILYSDKANYWTQKSFSLTVQNMRSLSQSYQISRAFKSPLGRLNVPLSDKSKTLITYSTSSHIPNTPANTLVFSYSGEPAKITTSCTTGSCQPNCIFGFLKYFHRTAYYKIPLKTSFVHPHCFQIPLLPAREVTSLSYEANNKANCSRGSNSCHLAMHI